MHPEQMEDEIFVSNILPEWFKETIWKTKRLGIVAYGGKGEVLQNTELKPLFVKKEEFNSKQ